MLPLMGLLSTLGLALFYGLLAYAVIGAAPHAALGTPAAVEGSAAVALACILGSALLFPWLLDRMVPIQWLELEAAGDVGPFLRKLLEKHACPPPRLGVTVDPNPYALTYGVRRGAARLVVSSGLLEALDVDEQCAVMAHEASHLIRADFVPTTLLATPIVVLTLLVDFFQGTRRPEAATGSPNTGMFLSPIAGLLVRIYMTLLFPLGRAREAEADAFARQATSTEFLRSALFRMTFRLGSAPAPGGAAQKSFALAARGFAPIDAGAAGRAATLAAASGAHLTPEALAGVLRDSAANPCENAAARLDLHPQRWPDAADEVPDEGGFSHPIKQRDLGGDRDVAPENMRRVASELHRQHALVGWLPALGFAVGLLLSMALRGWFGLPLVLWGVGRVAYVLLTLVLQRTPLPETPASPGPLLRELPRWWGASFRVSLDGRLCGFGIPGQTWSPDMILETDGGYLPVRLRHPLGIFHQFASSTQIGEMAGQAVTVHGWLRVRDVPYLEVHRLQAGGENVFTSWFVPVHVAFSALLIVMGILLIVPQWLGL